MFYRNIPDILKIITDSLDVDINFKTDSSEINNIDSEESYPMFILLPTTNVLATDPTELTDSYSVGWVLVDKLDEDATEAQVLDVLNTMDQLSKSIFLTFENEFGYETKRINGEQIDFNVTDPYTAIQVTREDADNRTGWAVTFTIENVNNDELCDCPISIPDCPPATVIDSDGVTVVSVDSGGVFACTLAATQSGIAYQRPEITGQDVSQALFDDAWQIQNGQRDYTPPTNPIHLAQLDYSVASPFTTLKVNNVFGNLFRFTGSTGGYQQDDLVYKDKDGVTTTQALAFPDDYVICNLTGLGWTLIKRAEATFTTHLTNADNLVLAGFSDWFLPDTKVMGSIMNFDRGQHSTLNAMTSYPPFNISDLVGATSTTRADVPTDWLVWFEYTIVKISKTTAFISFYYRNHFV